MQACVMLEWYFLHPYAQTGPMRAQKISQHAEIKASVADYPGV